MTEDNVVDFKTGLGVGDGIRLRADDILNAAQGEYRKVVLVGETEAGEIRVCGTDGAPESLMLLQWASAYLVANRVAHG